MKPRNSCSRIILFALLAAFLIAFVACSDDDEITDPKPTPPDLPPTASFIMDFSDFAGDGDQLSPWIGAAADTSYINWGQCAFRVGFWNLALTVTLAVPVIAFVEAFNHEPVEQEDGSWEWSYNVTVSVLHTCRLVGWTEAGEIHWEMYISKEGDYSDYLWYYGCHNLPATEGVWTVNQGPNQTSPFLSIEWHRNPVSETGDLKYTNIVPETAQNGSYIFYGSDTDTDYDRFYHLYNVVEDNLAEIEWNLQNKNGRVKDEFFYNDTDWHCWSETLEDVACP